MQKVRASALHGKAARCFVVYNIIFSIANETVNLLKEKN